MRTILAPRAAAILYQLLKSQDSNGTWLLPANICPIVPLTFFKAGFPVQFVDISPENLSMDLEAAADRLTKEKYGGLLYAHTYGEPSTPNRAFREIKSRYPELLLVDDRCLCAPALESDADTIADVTLYSTGYAKQIDLEYGGYAFIKDDVTYYPHRLPFDPQAQHKVEEDYKRSLESRTAYVYRDSAWLCTDGHLPTWDAYREQIRTRSEELNPHRARLNEIYASALPNEAQLPPEFQMWRFNLRLENRNHIMSAISSAGLFASTHYASLGGVISGGYFPQAELLGRQVINLFNDSNFDTTKALQICAVILENLSAG
ncbi:DegT/DnrJ/EryC1/StrS family aminotransferase [Mycobacterium lehmannii]|uniref:DegT/DnrJ/EryC1/StrS family aminotransferase n=1 Tax=Mycobacterium lehmannii TaxID=2048550 RepID=UPI0011550FC6|nr:DegT/DnrJ/EryC1/StrS family aminotransferase [Mycobacterium lehmannii]